ncbi:hypothetical protein ACE6H2_016715 [Prunus campanulata]
MGAAFESSFNLSLVIGSRCLESVNWYLVQFFLVCVYRMLEYFKEIDSPPPVRASFSFNRF